MGDRLCGGTARQPGHGARHGINGLKEAWGFPQRPIHVKAEAAGRVPRLPVTAERCRGTEGLARESCGCESRQSTEERRPAQPNEALEQLRLSAQSRL